MILTLYRLQTGSNWFKLASMNGLTRCWYRNLCLMTNKRGGVQVSLHISDARCQVSKWPVISFILKLVLYLVPSLCVFFVNFQVSLESICAASPVSFYFHSYLLWLISTLLPLCEVSSVFLGHRHEQKKCVLLLKEARHLQGPVLLLNDFSVVIISAAVSCLWLALISHLMICIWMCKKL